MAFLVGGANTLSAGYYIDNSLRFNYADSPRLLKAGTASAGTTWTHSVWVKYDSNANYNFLFCDGNQEGVAKNTSGFLYANTSGDQNGVAVAAATRDYSAWYHIVTKVSSGAATIYVNNVSVKADATFPSALTDNLSIGSFHREDTDPDQYNYFHGGYMADVNFIDGSALNPSSFAEADEDSGIWKPIDTSDLTFGTNGFRLEFKNSAVGTGASDTIGADTSGNDNHFTSTNVAVTDQTTDSPTNNWCTLNSLTARGSTGNTLAEGNLQYSAVAGAGDSSVFGTIGIPPEMKVYFEVKLVQNTAQNAVGIHSSYDCGDGEYCRGGSEVGTYSFKPRGSASVTQYFTDNDGGATNHDVNNAANDTILGVAIDNENGQIHYHLDGTYINSSDPTDNNPVALVTGFGGASEQYIHTSLDTSGGTEPINQFNFGNPVHSISSSQSDDNGYGNFEFDVPAGYYALCTKNLAKYG